MNISETFKATSAEHFGFMKAAESLSRSMRNAMLSAHTTVYSVATAIGQRRTLAALQRRGLIGNDFRWTAKGRMVAAIIRGGQEDPGHVRMLDELHEEAQTEDAKRFPAAPPTEIRRIQLAGRAIRRGVQPEDHRIGGPCQVQASLNCTGEASQVRMDPRAMLPESGTSTTSVPTCEPCLQWLTDDYLFEVTKR